MIIKNSQPLSRQLQQNRSGFFEQDVKKPLLKSISSLQELHVDSLSGDQNAQKNQILTSSKAKAPKAGFILSVGILIKTTIGAGILSLPYVIQQMGIILAIIFYIITSSLIIYSSVTYLHSKNMSGSSNIATIMTSIHPNGLSKAVVSGIVVLGTLGGCVAFNLLLKQTIRKILTNYRSDQPFLDSFLTSQQFIVIVSAILWLPLIFMAKIQQLRIFSLIGVIGVIIFLISFVIYFVLQISQGSQTLKPMKLYPTEWLSAFSTVPNIIFSLGFYMNFFPIYKGLIGANDSKMKKLVFTGVLCCCLMYISIGVMGRLLIGQQINQNLLKSLDYNNMGHGLYYLIYLGFIVELFFAYPVVFFSCKNNFICIINIALAKIYKTLSFQNSSQKDQMHSGRSQLIALSQQLRRQKIINIVGTLLIFLIIQAISYVFNNVQVVFNLIGALSSSSMNFLLPNYYYVKLVSLNNYKKDWKYYFSFGILVVMIPFCLFLVVALYLK